MIVFFDVLLYIYMIIYIYVLIFKCWFPSRYVDLKGTSGYCPPLSIEGAQKNHEQVSEWRGLAEWFPRLSFRPPEVSAKVSNW